MGYVVQNVVGHGCDFAAGVEQTGAESWFSAGGGSQERGAREMCGVARDVLLPPWRKNAGDSCFILELIAARILFLIRDRCNSSVGIVVMLGVWSLKGRERSVLYARWHF